MTRFDRDQSSLIDKQIREDSSLPRVGVVSQVFEHSAPDDDSNFEVDVTFDNGVATESRVPVYSAGTGTIHPPKNGDKILIIYRDGDSNRPIAFGNGWSKSDRAPTGLAGMRRTEIPSSFSPATAGNLYVTEYASYSDSVASKDKRQMIPEQAVVQIAKHEDGKNVNPINSSDTVPAKVEFYDSTTEDKSHISVEINAVDGGDSDVTWGMKFNIKTGEWKLVGPSGFGVESDGSGNFVWHHKSIDFNEVDGDTGPLSL